MARFAALLAGLPPTTPGVTVNRLCARAACRRSGRRARRHRRRRRPVPRGRRGEHDPRALRPGKAGLALQPRRQDLRHHHRRALPQPEIRSSSSATTPCPRPATTWRRTRGIARAGGRVRARLAAEVRGREGRGLLQGRDHGRERFPAKKKAPPDVSSRTNTRAATATHRVPGEAASPVRGGVVTAGNASGVNDGAAALLVGSRDGATKNGKKPIAKILSAASAGVEPRIMGVGPAYASRKALQRAGLGLKDMDIIEINEAFASQVLGCLRIMDVDFKDPRVNPNGGAIAIGHPLGASGARLALTVSRELQQSGGRYAAVSLCIGVGQGLAVILERIERMKGEHRMCQERGRRKAGFVWEDPLLLEQQLTDDERMVRDSARLLPGQARAARARGVPPREDRPDDLPRDGRARPARPHHPRAEYGGAGPELRQLRPGRARGRARRFGLPLDDERAGLAGDGADQRVRHRGAEGEVPAEAGHRRVDRLLRPHRAEPRLRSGRHDDAREEGRRRLRALPAPRRGSPTARSPTSSSSGPRTTKARFAASSSERA